MKKVCSYSRVLAIALAVLFVMKALFAVPSFDVPSWAETLRKTVAAAMMVVFWAMLFRAVPRDSQVRWLAIAAVLVQLLNVLQGTVVPFAASHFAEPRIAGRFIGACWYVMLAAANAVAIWTVFVFARGSSLRRLAVWNVLIPLFGWLLFTLSVVYMTHVPSALAPTISIASIVLNGIVMVLFFLEFSRLCEHRTEQKPGLFF